MQMFWNNEIRARRLPKGTHSVLRMWYAEIFFSGVYFGHSDLLDDAFQPLSFCCKLRLRLFFCMLSLLIELREKDIAVARSFRRINV